MMARSKLHSAALFMVVSLFTTLLGPAPALAKMEEISLSVGEETTIDNVQQYGVENPSILSATASRDGKSLILRGLRSGSTKIVVRGEGKTTDRTLDVSVAARDPKLLQQELDGLLRNYPEVSLRTNRNLVVMEGSVKTERELVQLKEIEKRYDGQVQNLVTIGASGPRRNAMIRLDLHYVQVRRRLQRNLGIKYPPNIQGSTVLTFALDPTHQLTSMAAGMTSGMTGSAMPVQQQSILDLMPSLDLNEANGFVKIMRTDTLVVRNGEKATYRNGVESIFKLQGTLGAGTLERVFYGAALAVTPRLSASNDGVSLELVADLSQRDSQNSDGIPGRIIDYLETNLHIPLGQSMMLAGLESQAAARTTTGIPWLNRIPVLGYLFGSEGKDAESAYGVVYITPTLVQEGNPGLQGRIDTALRYFEKPGLLKR